MYLVRFQKKDKTNGYQLVIKDCVNGNRCKEYIEEEKALKLVELDICKMYQAKQVNTIIVYNKDLDVFEEKESD